MNKGQASQKINNIQEQNYDNQLSVSPLTSFHLKNQLNTASIQHPKQKIDIGVMTDQIICRCDCEQIAKLKQKAHKSFMQVIQIENLYKQEIEQIQEQYEEREKTQLKKFQCKESLLAEKCKQLEQQLEKNREYLEKCREEQLERKKIGENNVLEFSVESPFIIDNVQDIYPLSLESQAPNNPDDSIDTIRHLKEFIPSQNLHEQHEILRNNLLDFIEEFKGKLSKTNNNSEIANVFARVQKSINEVMQLVKLLIDNAVVSQQKYNNLYRVNSQLQNRYNKTINAFDASQKQIKFMSEHIRRISQDKINIDRKYHEIDKNNRQLEETVKFLKKNLVDKGKDEQKREEQIISDINYREDEDDIKIEMKSKKSQHSPLFRLASDARQPNSLKKRPLFMHKKE